MNFSFSRKGTFSEMSPLSRTTSQSIQYDSQFNSPPISRSNSQRSLTKQFTKPISRSPSVYSSLSRYSTMMASPVQSHDASQLNERCVKVSVRLKSPANWNFSLNTINIDSRTYLFGIKIRIQCNEIDHVITEQNQVMYTKTCSDTIDKLINGQNATIFTYGATNSGKTFTMYGSESQGGIVPIALEQLFEQIAIFKIAYYEIYNETVRDLLLMGEYTKAPSVIRVKSLKHAQLLIKNGSRFQHVEGTEWNSSSTRGHTVLQVVNT